MGTSVSFINRLQYKESAVLYEKDQYITEQGSGADARAGGGAFPGNNGWMGVAYAQGSLLLTWFNFNPDMDKQSHA